MGKQTLINKSSIISYHKDDPRYNLNIDDSSKYNKNIYPLHLSKKCHNKKNYGDFIKYDYPPIDRCWGERYENCSTLMGDDNSPLIETGLIGPNLIEAGNCSCSECILNIYGPVEDTIGYARIDLGNSKRKKSADLLRRSDFKQNNSTIYDSTRIMKTDGLDILNYPDNNSRKSCNSNSAEDQIEPFVGKIFSKITDGICSGIIKLCCPKTFSDNVSPSMSCFLCLIILIFLCVISSCVASQAAKFTPAGRMMGM